MLSLEDRRKRAKIPKKTLAVAAGIGRQTLDRVLKNRANVTLASVKRVEAALVEAEIALAAEFGRLA